MTIFRKILISTSILLGSIIGAVAADLPPPIQTPMLPQPQVFDWTGHYIGIHGLYGYAPYTSSGFPGQTFSADGFMGGGQIGFDWQHGHTVYGIEASGSYGSLSRDGVTFDDKVPWLALVRGRLGYTFDHALFGGIGHPSDQFMVYAIGGLAIAGIESTSASGKDSATGTGWTVGVGIEKRLWGSHSLTLEYDYVDLSPTQLSSTFDGSAHIAKIGLNFRNLWN